MWNSIFEHFKCFVICRCIQMSIIDRFIGFYMNWVLSCSKFLVEWQLHSLNGFYVVYIQLLRKSYALVGDFGEMHTQISGFLRLFHLSNGPSTHLLPMYSFYSPYTVQKSHKLGNWRKNFGPDLAFTSIYVLLFFVWFTCTSSMFLRWFICDTSSYVHNDQFQCN